jgi:hypothetical protein
MTPGQKEVERPALEKGEKEEKAPEEEAFLFSEKPSLQKVEEVVPVRPLEEERSEAEPVKPKRMVRRERRGPSLFFVLIFVLVLLVFGAFYLWSEIGSGGNLSPYLESPVKKITDLWGQIWGTEKEDLIVGIHLGVRFGNDPWHIKNIRKSKRGELDPRVGFSVRAVSVTGWEDVWGRRRHGWRRGAAIADDGLAHHPVLVRAGIRPPAMAANTPASPLIRKAVGSKAGLCTEKFRK